VEMAGKGGYGTTTQDPLPSKRDDEVGFLLANVNEGESSQAKRVRPTDNVLPKRDPWDASPMEILRHNFKWLLIGFILLAILMTSEITFGLFVSALGLLITWLFAWLGVCCGGFFCYFRKPQAMHICHGAVVGLIFGILAMASFSVFVDIDNRELFQQVPVDGSRTIIPATGGIIFFQQASIYQNFIGESYQEVSCSGRNCDKRYYCVAPLLPQDTIVFNISLNPVFFWVGCESDKNNENCRSQSFVNSDCYKNWGEPWNSAFIMGGELEEHYRIAVNDALARYNFNSTPADKTITVAWVPDPLSEANIFWALGVFAVCIAPIIYVISGALYAVFCKVRVASSAI